MYTNHRYSEQQTNPENLPQKMIVGPIYQDGTSKHSYVEQPKPDHLKQNLLKAPIYQNDDYKHHFSQIEEHLESLKNLTAPIYNKEGGKTLFNAILDRVESLKSLQGPVYGFGKAGHKYEGDQNYVLNYGAGGVEKGQELNGPLYKIDREHQFSEVISQVNKLKELSGPIFDLGDTNHGYNELHKKVETLKQICHPVLVDERHQYSEQKTNPENQPQKMIVGPIYMEGTAKHSYKEEPKPDHLKQVLLRGPIYQNDDYKHHFSQIDEHMEALKTLKGPVYDVQSKSHFNAIVEHVEAVKAMQGPVYNFGNAGHKYEGDQNYVLNYGKGGGASDQKPLHGPKYHIDNEHEFSEILKKVDQLKDLVGPVYAFGESGHQFHGLVKHVESLRTLMGPVFVDERHR